MNIKTLILVIILSILIGIGIFTAEKIFNNSPLTSTTSQSSNSQTQKNLPTPTPKPSYPPITPTTDLKQEIDKLTTPDFSQDYKELKNQF